MKNVTFPLKPQMKGPEVANLQAALQEAAKNAGVGLEIENGEIFVST